MNIGKYWSVDNWIFDTEKCMWDIFKINCSSLFKPISLVFIIRQIESIRLEEIQ